MPSRAISVPIAFQDKTGLIWIDQMRTLDKRWLVRRMGHVGTVPVNLLLATIREVFEE